MSDMNVNDREGIAQLVEGKSDDELNQLADAAGVDSMLDQVFEGIKDSFHADKAAGQSAVIQWSITGSDGATRDYQLNVADGTCTLTKGTPDAAKVTLQLALPDFLRLISGKLDGMQAFMQGKLKLQGDMMFAQTMQPWFG